MYLLLDSTSLGYETAVSKPRENTFLDDHPKSNPHPNKNLANSKMLWEKKNCLVLKELENQAILVPGFHR